MPLQLPAAVTLWPLCCSGRPPAVSGQWQRHWQASLHHSPWKNSYRTLLHPCPCPCTTRLTCHLMLPLSLPLQRLGVPMPSTSPTLQPARRQSTVSTTAALPPLPCCAPPLFPTPLPRLPCCPAPHGVGALACLASPLHSLQGLCWQSASAWQQRPWMLSMILCSWSCSLRTLVQQPSPSSPLLPWRPQPRPSLQSCALSPPLLPAPMPPLHAWPALYPVHGVGRAAAAAAAAALQRPGCGLPSQSAQCRSWQVFCSLPAH